MIRYLASAVKAFSIVLICLSIPGKGYAYHAVPQASYDSRGPEGADEVREKISFMHISVNDGLSQNTVLSCSQDKLGQMWFATLDGLNRYDGYEFRIYRNEPEDSTSIANDIIRKVYLDLSGRLWIGTGKGLSLYDTDKDAFRNFLTQDRAVTGIVDVGGDRIMVAAGGDLIFFDTASMTWSDKELLHQAGRLGATVLYSDGDKIWIGTSENGLFCWSADTGAIKRIFCPPQNAKSIQCLFKHEGLLWIATEGDGLWYLNDSTGETGNFRHERNNPRSLSSNYVRTLSTDSYGRLWVGTYNGLSIREEDGFLNIGSEPFQDRSLSQSSVRCIKMDNQGGMWLGTYFGGINYWHPLMNKFTIIHRQSFENSLNDNVVSCITEDTDQNSLWIGTNSGGVNHYDTRNGTFTAFTLRQDGRQNLESDDIKAIHIDKESGLVYIGAHAGGLSAINRRTRRILHFNNPDVNDPMNVYSIIQADRYNLWIGTLEGLRLFDTRNQTFRSFDLGHAVAGPDRNRIRTLMTDSEGKLWVGGDYGFRRFDIEDGQLVEDKLPLNDKILTESFVQCFFESSTSLIWIGTRRGLLCFDRIEGSLTKYTSEDGLPSDIIHGIEEDNFGRLWISTDRGLSCFNPFSGQFRNFTTDDGLQGNQFNTGSHVRRANGEMMFGGIGGITAFFPEMMEDNPYTPRPIITSLVMFGREIRPCDETGILKTGISYTDRIVLKHDQNSFSVRFSVPNYLAGHHNRFAYMLEGYDRHWHETDQTRSVSWSSLPHGEYRFLVKAANNDGKWNDEPTVLEIRVRPVWYLTIAAKIGFAIFAIMLVAAAYLRLVRRKNEENRLELAKQEKAHQEEIHQMKMRFYINISHEMRTPLTLIINPLSEMISKCNDTWMRKQLKYVERNTQRLLHLVNQLMDYRRAELDVFKLKVRKEDVLRILKENCSLYDKLAFKKKLRYSLTTNLEGQTAYVDGQYMELILNNLLSNAFKYTDSGSISVKANLTTDSLVLEISDTGAGIPAVEQDRIFERFYQMENEHIGSGIGLSLVQRLVELHHGKIELKSEEGKGSTFTVILPQDLSVYSAEELGGQSSEIHTANSKDMYILDTDSEEVAVEQNEGDGIKKGRIIIAEDNGEVSGYMLSGLSGTFETRVAANGAEVLEIMKEFVPDIIITDIMMPVMDGIKLCSHIKQNAETSHIPVIVISSKTDKKEQLEAFRNGADDFIIKPFSMAVLNAKIRNMMRTQMRVVDKAVKSMDIEPEKISFNAMDEQILKQAIAIVEKNMDNAEFSTEEFAREMNMSRSNLHIKLKALTGESALDFIRKIRFKEACRLLLDGRYSISEISDMVGFNTPSYFATCFKKYMGCLPTEWIRSHRS
ncbi:MAG: two-component regulator propeller domain-containing protein [Candidatus Cryptobacteroides sp.]